MLERSKGSGVFTYDDNVLSVPFPLSSSSMIVVVTAFASIAGIDGDKKD